MSLEYYTVWKNTTKKKRRNECIMKYYVCFGIPTHRPRSTPLPRIIPSENESKTLFGGTIEFPLKIHTSRSIPEDLPVKPSGRDLVIFDLIYRIMWRAPKEIHFSFLRRRRRRVDVIRGRIINLSESMARLRLCGFFGAGRRI